MTGAEFARRVLTSTDDKTAPGIRSDITIEFDKAVAAMTERAERLTALLGRASQCLETANAIIKDECCGDEEDYADAAELIKECNAALAEVRRG